VVPQVVSVFANTKQKLPTLTIVMLWLSDFVRNWWWAGLIVIGIIVAILRSLLKQPDIRLSWHRWLLTAPLVGKLIRGYNTARFASTLAILVSAGVPILRTLEIVSAASGKCQIEDACEEIAKHVSQGGQVSEVLAANEFFPPMMKHMVKAGESTGNVDGMMNKIADFYDVECEATVGALTSLIEPMLIVFLGVVVGGIVMAMFLPIFQLGAVAGGL
jgi:type II secretory pathway component PulF